MADQQTAHELAQTDPKMLRELAEQLRVDCVRASSAADSGHPTSGMSAADLMAVLAAKYLHYNFEDPDDPNSDHLIFSKGHATPLLYAFYRAAGAISDEELLTYRTFNSRLEGHPTPSVPWVKVSTGSLGQGLPAGVGLALAGKHLDRLPYHTWVLCGDSEMAEGSMWEAFEHAGHYQLGNLTAILDVNRLGQRGPTMHEWDLDRFLEPARAFGWNAIAVDGHDVEAIDAAFAEAVETTDRPTVIVARTLKGKGVSAVEDQEGKHGKAIDEADTAIEELGGVRNLRIDVAKPANHGKPHSFESGPLELPRFEVGEEAGTRKAYGEALAALASGRGDVVGLDAEINNSTYSLLFARAHPDRFFEMYISEQQMMAAAVAFQARGWVPYASTFAAFHTRAFDFVRMAAVGRANFCCVGSHTGVSIGQDGPTQMGLEDLAMYRAVHGSTVLAPCDANQVAHLVERMADLSGIRYMRTVRPATPVVYEPEEDFEVGGSRVLRASDDDQVTLVGAGITVHGAREAAETLDGEGIRARVVDCYSIKPIDAEVLRTAARETGRIVTVEDHWPEGGLGDAVLEALADTEECPRVTKLAVREMPHSGKPQELLAATGIDASGIAETARRLVRG